MTSYFLSDFGCGWGTKASCGVSFTLVIGYPSRTFADLTALEFDSFDTDEPEPDVDEFFFFLGMIVCRLYVLRSVSCCLLWLWSPKAEIHDGI